MSGLETVTSRSSVSDLTTRLPRILLGYLYDEFYSYVTYQLSSYYSSSAIFKIKHKIVFINIVIKISIVLNELILIIL